MTPAGADLLRDQSGTAANAAAVRSTLTRLDPIPGQHFELVHGDLLIVAVNYWFWSW
ncbi:MAG: hypothetical protein ABIZ07_02235 [Dermatophilaceae bacterium]